MARKSQLAGHPNRLDMERRYLQGESMMKIARDNNVSYNSLYEHCTNHVSRQMVTAYEKKALAENTDMLVRIDNIIIRAERIFTRNYEKQKDLVALKALSEQRSTLELLAKISFALHSTKQLEAEERMQKYSVEEQEDFQESLSVLTFAELEMLSLIQNKLDTQDRKNIIIPDTPNPFKFPTKRTTPHIDTDPEEKTAESDGKMVRTNNLPPPDRPRPIKPTEIPFTKYRDHPLRRRR